VPLVLVNARMSARSHARWALAPKAIGQLLGTFDLCLAQTEAEAETWIAEQKQLEDDAALEHLEDVVVVTCPAVARDRAVTIVLHLPRSVPSPSRTFRHENRP